MNHPRRLDPNRRTACRGRRASDRWPEPEVERSARPGFIFTVAGITALVLVLASWARPSGATRVAAPEQVASGIRTPAGRSVARGSKPMRAVTAPPVAPRPASLSDRWGIEASDVQLSAGGRLLDIRCRVVDAKKAAPLAASSERVYLIDQTSGRTLSLPGLPRHQASRLEQGRALVMLAANTGQLVKAGDRVTLVMGGSRVTGLEVR